MRQASFEITMIAGIFCFDAFENYRLKKTK